jgi:hypothetical protein
LKFQRRRKDFVPDFGTIQRKEGIVRILETRKMD